jgi:Flp pilus assembly protein TadG
MATRRHDRTPRRDRGAVIAEFALIVPILLVLLVGIIEFGRAYNVQIALQGAAREGARALALGESPNTAVSTSSGGIPMTISSSTGCPASSDPASYATVTTSADFTFRIPFVTLGTKTLNASASMRCGL